MRLLSITLLLVLPICLSAQFQLGWRTDAYAGINSALINPALPAKTDYAWDINLAEGTAFFANNYGYLRDVSAIELFRLRDSEFTFIQERELTGDTKPGAETLVYDFIDKENYYVQTLISAMGPSFSVRVAPLTRVGVFTRFQTMFSTTDIEEDIGYDRWQEIEDELLFMLDKQHIAGAAWAEVGLNFNQGVITNVGVLTFGLSVRRLWGERAVYIVNNSQFELSKLPGYVGLSGVDFDIDVAFSNNLIEENVSTEPNGKGWGVDLGFLYQIDEGEGFYRWEFGASLLNLGSIRFTNGQLHNYTSAELEQMLTADYENYDINDGLDVLFQQFSGDIYENTQTSLEADEFKLGLPTTLSANAAYAFNEWVRVEANVLMSIAPFGPTLNHSSVVALTPRMDRRWWSVGLPISLFASRQPRIGLAARLGPVFMGTDQLGALTKGGRFTGGDFYFGIKLHPLGLNTDGERKKKLKGRRKGGKDVKCYTF